MFGWIFILNLICQVSRCQSDEGWFWHVTDFHWDVSYWHDHLSCVNVDNLTRLDNYYGNEWCDSPWQLVKASVTGLNDVMPNVDFVLWTGDTVPHIPSSALSTSTNEGIIRNVTNVMKEAFGNTTIYATFGNHDYYPSNMFPPHENEIYNTTYEMWKAWVGDDSQRATFLKGGYYTLLISPGLRIMALNTNMYYTKSTINQNLTDPAGQFAWMERELSMANSNNEKVIITGHVPPGFTTPRRVRWMSKTFNQRFVEIILRHSRVIVAMHFGHEHHDSFRMFYDEHGIPVVSLFLAPSVTPWRYQMGEEKEPPHNPGARLIKYNRQNGKQLEIRQYFVDINVTNENHKTGSGGFQWNMGYNITAMYNIPDITPVSMDKVIKRMTNADAPEFKHFVNWYNTNANASEYPCHEQCYQVVMCGLQYMLEEPFQRCLAALTSGPIVG